MESGHFTHFMETYHCVHFFLINLLTDYENPHTIVFTTFIYVAFLS